MTLKSSLINKKSCLCIFFWWNRVPGTQNIKNSLPSLFYMIFKILKLRFIVFHGGHFEFCAKWPSKVVHISFAVIFENILPIPNTMQNLREVSGVARLWWNLKCSYPAITTINKKTKQNMLNQLWRVLWKSIKNKLYKTSELDFHIDLFSYCLVVPQPLPVPLHILHVCLRSLLQCVLQMWLRAYVRNTTHSGKTCKQGIWNTKMQTWKTPWILSATFICSGLEYLPCAVLEFVKLSPSIWM